MPTKGPVIENDPADLRDFYEMVCFTHSLSIVRGERIKPASSVESDGFEVAKCRRDFADAIAYFCAYTPSPDKVTAVALGRMDKKVVVWVASNATVSACVLEFLDKCLLNTVQGLAATKEGQLPSGEHESVTALLGEILRFTKKKIFKYYKPAIAIRNKIWEFGNPDSMRPRLGQVLFDFV